MTYVPSKRARDGIETVEEIFHDAWDRTPLTARHDQGFDATVWSELVAGDWHLLGVSAEHGGGGLHLVDLVAVGEMCGRWLACVPLSTTVLANRWLDATYRAPLPMATFVAAKGAGRGWAPFGDLPGMTCLGGTALTVVDVTGERDGFSFSLPLAAATSPGAPSERQRFEAAVMLTASAVGAADAARSRATAHARQRKQFGKPIGQFQAIAHLLADMYRDVSLARSAVAWAAANESAGERGVWAALRLAQDVVDGAIHVHGGIGFTWDAGVHFYLRHVMQARKLARALTAGNVSTDAVARSRDPGSPATGGDEGRAG